MLKQRKILKRLFYLTAIISLLQILVTVNAQVPNEIANWKFYPEEECVSVLIPYEMLGAEYKRLYGDSVWKYYFKDGFVVTVSKQGKLLQAYYSVSEQHYEQFISNFKNILDNKIKLDSAYLTRRFALMRLYATNNLDKLVFRVKSEDDDSVIEFVIFDMFHAGLFEEAVNRLTQIIGKLSDRAGKYLALRALAYFALNRDEELQRDAKSAYEILPQNRWSMIAMAIACIRAKKETEAIDLLARREALDSLAKTEKTPFLSLLEAIAYSSLGQIERGLEIYSKLPQDFVESDSRWFQTYFRWLYKYFTNYNLALAREAYKRNRLDQAMGFYKEALKFADEDEILQLIKESLPLVKKYPDMLELSEDARKLVIKAEIYLGENNVIKAIKEYKNALKVSPFASDTYRALAQAYARIGQYEQAIKYMRIFLELNPEHREYELIKDQIYKWESMLKQHSR